ncbi:hypothetical protein HYO65_gp031 [Tenacibaculum phage PTm1]|uniref:Uncharacterized protein n=2 Tax=Shirahamavirus PTm1 TaxID=2846435 RepID=A0A5S9HX98_9CAUD|nr:hypothetical protein HYO65_gp031 [Tenacibaculum phage PTm1]BBI90423.1 hypothetical protein [Tenacibaculum phage PTm1]BBI90730.1 hypothetical protein [Tenacibaculum phage PTm5]
MATGNSTVARFDYPLIFNITQPAPIDSRFTISSVSNLATELPSGVRYKGLIVWVEDVKTFYYFKDGILDTNFIVFTLGSAGVTKFIYNAPDPITNGELFNHGLNTEEFTIGFILNNKPVIIDYELLPYDASNPTHHLNNIKLMPPIGYTIPMGLKIIMMY